MTSGLGIAVLVAMLLFTHEMARARRARAERALAAEAARRQQAERLATEARLASLESRLQPHFLRNALNTIAHHMVADPPRAEELLEQLAALLGASLERTTRRTVPLREEIRMVWDFLDIEQAQLGERLRWQLESLREVHGYEVPPFSLQSLVHNSVKHVAARRPDGRRDPRGDRAPGRPAGGVGLGRRAGVRSGQRAEGARARHAAPATRCPYGQRAGLEVRREEGGTRVVMRLPASEAVRSPA